MCIYNNAGSVNPVHMRVSKLVVTISTDALAASCIIPSSNTHCWLKYQTCYHSLPIFMAIHDCEYLHSGQTISFKLAYAIIVVRSYRTASRFAPSQWETLLQSNNVSHWLGANLEWALYYQAILDDNISVLALVVPLCDLGQFHRQGEVNVQNWLVTELVSIKKSALCIDFKAGYSKVPQVWIVEREQHSS